MDQREWEHGVVAGYVARIRELEAIVEVMGAFIRDMPVETLEHVRKPAIDALKKHRIFTLGTLERYTPERLLRLENFGVTSLNDLRYALKARGLSLEEDHREDQRNNPAAK